MRKRLSENHPRSPLLLYVGRLGYEKKIDRLKQVLDANPNARLALVGTGPAEEYLKNHFKNYPVHFTGQLQGMYIILLLLRIVSNWSCISR